MFHGTITNCVQIMGGKSKIKATIIIISHHECIYLQKREVMTRVPQEKNIETRSFKCLAGPDWR